MLCHYFAGVSASLSSTGGHILSGRGYMQRQKFILGSTQNSQKASDQWFSR